MRHAHSFILLFAAVLAATAYTSLRADQGQRQFRLTTLGPRINDAGYQSGSGGQSPLRLLPSYIAGPYRYSGNRIRITRTDVSGLPVTLAEASVPASVANPLLLLLPFPSQTAEGETLPYSAVTLEESLAAAPMHSIRFLNVSADTVAISFARGAPRTLQPGASDLITFQPPEPADSYRALHIARQLPNGEWERITSRRESDIYLEQDCRYLVIIHPPTQNRPNAPRIGISIIPDTSAPRVLRPQEITTTGR